ncbi:MAG: hypothetical protein M0R76_00485 [Proteobacteria bacterium]|nr:hypothetical protein [Pseudomonadota bacterium]
MDTKEKQNRIYAKFKHEIGDIESRTDLTDDKKAERIIVIFASVCAGVAVQPIPFADIFILTPIQGYMATRLSAIRGEPIKEKDGFTIFKEVMGLVGLGLLAQQLIIGAYKTFIPFLGAVTTIPLVFAATYGIGKVLDAYFQARVKGKKLDKATARAIWKQAKAEGKKKGKERTEEIIEENKE